MMGACFCLADLSHHHKKHESKREGDGDRQKEGHINRVKEIPNLSDCSFTQLHLLPSPRCRCLHHHCFSVDWWGRIRLNKQLNDVFFPSACLGNKRKKSFFVSSSSSSIIRVGPSQKTNDDEVNHWEGSWTVYGTDKNCLCDWYGKAERCKIKYFVRVYLLGAT